MESYADVTSATVTLTRVPGTAIIGHAANTGQQDERNDSTFENLVPDSVSARWNVGGAKKPRNPTSELLLLASSSRSFPLAHPTVGQEFDLRNLKRPLSSEFATTQGLSGVGTNRVFRASCANLKLRGVRLIWR